MLLLVVNSQIGANQKNAAVDSPIENVKVSFITQETLPQACPNNAEKAVHTRVWRKSDY